MLTMLTRKMHISLIFGAVLMAMAVKIQTDAYTTIGKKYNLVLHYMYYDNDGEKPTWKTQGGEYALRDLVCDIVNSQDKISKDYYVYITMHNSIYIRDKKLGPTIRTFYSIADKETGGLLSVADPSINHYMTDNPTTGQPWVKYSPLLYGPESSNEAKTIGQLVEFFNMVTISSRAASGALADRKLYPRFHRTYLGGDAYTTLPRALLKHLGYTTTALVYLDGTLGSDTMQSIQSDLLSHNYVVLYKQTFIPNDNDSFHQLATDTLLYDTRIFTIFSNDGSEYKMLCDAIKTIGPDVFTSEKYLTIWLMLENAESIQIFQPKYQANPPTLPLGCTQEMLDRFLAGSLVALVPTYDPTYSGLLNMGGLTITQLRDELLTRSRLPKYGGPTVPYENILESNANTADMFWAGILALDAFEKNGGFPIAGYSNDPNSPHSAAPAKLMAELFKLKFRGATGIVSFNPKSGGVMVDVPIVQYHPGRNFSLVLNYIQEDMTVKEVEPLEWYTSDGKPPLDKKPAPDLEAQQRQMIAIIAAVVSALVFIIIVVFIGVWWNNRRKLARALANPSWLFPRNLVKVRGATGGGGSMMDGAAGGGGGSYSMSMLAGSQASVSKGRTFTTALIMTDDIIVRMQTISPDATRLQVNEKNHKTMINFRDTLQHGNVVRLIGYTLFDFDGATNVCEQYLLWEHCEKGPLTELIDNTAFKLDSIFEFAILQDIAHGMAFLHQGKQSSIIGGAHGKLRPDTCFIDKRFSVKVGFYGEEVLAALFHLKNLRYSPTTKTSDEPITDEEKLYWAPEILRQNTDMPKGTFPADVYAFGFTIYSLLTRVVPFAAEAPSFKNATTTHDVVNMINNAQSPPLRPTLLAMPSDGEDSKDQRLLALMQRCWSEEPSERPTFPEISRQLRDMSRVKGKNASASLTDQLLTRLERYASDMEGLVGERTMELEREKKKSEELLHQILPPSIANELKTKGQVQPKSFDEVTIYFSDIVGFTVISSSSAPLQVVAMLNHLYTVFDGTIDQFDVYKVETIGDAYMCVSGLPNPNGNKHSREIALMSLSLLEQADKFVIPHRPGENLKLRIGLHSGSCVAGVVGLKMPRYCLFGDTVNTASRMESNGEALKIHISNACKLKLDEHGMFTYESRGELDIKGKGKMLTFWLTGSTNAPKESVRGYNPPTQRLTGDENTRGSGVKFADNTKSEFATNTKIATGPTKSFFSIQSFDDKPSGEA